MTVDIRKLTIFVAIAEEGSLTAAARKLQMAQPGVTVHLRKLEEALGLVLFERTKGRLGQLTLNGSHVLPLAKRLLDHWTSFGDQITALTDCVEH